MYQQSAPDSIQSMFASIAKNYDKANSLFSFGLHKRWNQQLIKSIGNPKKLLDLCAGTGEIAFGYLARSTNTEAILLDFCPQMLEVAEQKGICFQGRFKILCADAQSIPLPDQSVDAATISYGIRNVKDPSACFQEVYRVLSVQATFGILELTRPDSYLLRKGHSIYTKLLLPLFGQLAAKNKEAYQYLAKSIATFLSPSDLEHALKKAGFSKVTRRPLLGGISTLFLASKYS